MKVYPLERFSERALNVVASVIHGQEARVVLTNRIEPPAVVVLESRTAMLDPSRTDLYDLLLCARLLGRRAEERTRPRRPSVPGRVARRWAREAHESLRRDFPGCVRLSGRFHPDAGADVPHVVWQSVKYRPLPEGAAGGAALASVPGVQVTGAEEDFTWLAEVVRAGRFPQEHLAELGAMPVATVPLSLAFSHAYGPKYERLQRQIEETRPLWTKFMECYRRKSESLLEILPRGRRTLSGVRLDTTRLVDAVLARHTGLEPRLFQQRSSNFQPVFDPRQHFVILSIDLNDLHPGPVGDPAFSHRVLAGFLKAYDLLDVDFAVVGFADRVLPLDDGGRVYLHVPVPLKRIDEPFDATVWNRVAHVIDHPPRLPGQAACFHPLLMRSIGRLFDQAAADRAHSYRAVVFAARRGMPWESGEFHAPEFLARTAQALDREIEGMEKRFTGVVDTLAAWVPRELKDHGRKGGAVARMF